MNPATNKFAQAMLLSGMEAIDNWECWANVVPRGATKTLNQSLIRIAKGVVKSTRIFLVERQRESNNQFQSVSSRSFEAATFGDKKGDSPNGKIRVREKRIYHGRGR